MLSLRLSGLRLEAVNDHHADDGGLPPYADIADTAAIRHLRLLTLMRLATTPQPLRVNNGRF